MKRYVFRPYSDDYPRLFASEVVRIRPVLPGETVFEHVGSTAVPGLGGKGFIDMLVGVPEPEIEAAVAALSEIGYNFESDASTDERWYLDRHFVDESGQESMYHLHVTYPGSEDWRALLAFRDYLRANTQARREYADIKKHAAEISSQKR